MLCWVIYLWCHYTKVCRQLRRWPTGVQSIAIVFYTNETFPSELESGDLATLSLGWVWQEGRSYICLSLQATWITISCYTNEIFPSDSSHKELESGDLATLSLGVGVAGGAELHLPVIWMFSTISWLWTCPRSDSKPNNTNNPENKKRADKMGVWEIQCNAWWHHTDFLNVQTFGQEHILETFQNESIFQYNLVWNVSYFLTHCLLPV